ncbi:MAG: helix-turn-helix domain-containing protein [Alkaliphilus sp.]|nr:helix-turn-helix domain-containing protein [Alkaliphilus sp.]
MSVPASRRFDNLGDVLKPSEVRDFLGISQTTLYQWLQDGTIPAIKIGRRYMIVKQKFGRKFGFIS